MEEFGFDPSPPQFNLSDDDNIPQFSCDYRTTSGFQSETKNCSNGYFSLLSYNIRSCRRNFASFVTFLCSLMYKFSLIILVETWLSESADCAFDIDGYKQINVYRDNYGGGIKVFYDEVFDIEVCRDLTLVNNVMDVLTFFLIGENFKYLICSVYRSTGANPFLFNEMFFNLVISKLCASDKIIITGDFNLNLFNPLKLTFVDMYLSSMLAHGYFPVITLPAKINDQNTITPFSLIDQIWVNFKIGSNHDSGVLLYSLTDHFPIYYIFRNKCNGLLKTIKYRLINEDSIHEFVNKVSNTCLNRVFQIPSLNNAFNYFHGKLYDCYNSSFPIKKKKVKSNPVNAPWITPDLRICIKKKYKLFSMMRRGLIEKRYFNLYKNALTWVTNKLKQKYHFNTFESCKRDVKKTWFNINSLLDRSKREPVTRVVGDDGSVIEGPEIANHFNNYFISVVSRLTENLPHGIDFAFFNNIKRVVQSCFLEPTDEGAVCAIIQSMPNKGNSLWDFKPNILLSIKNIVGNIIAHLYNMSITVGEYPDILGIGRVVPVFKSGDKKKCNNYRPITTLSTINKIFELLTYSRMLKFIEKFKILSNLQFGFKKATSTTNAIFRFVSDVLPSFNGKSFTIALLLDLRKAFDLVDRDILLHKLSIIGFRGVTGSFLSSYLTNRKQYVNINEHISDTSSINLGVPQGSVLGPLLFNLFINDIVNVGDAKKILFADDAVFYITEDSLEQCVIKMRFLIAELSDWLKRNKLIPNVDKTKLMMFTPRPIERLPDIYFDGIKLEWVRSFKYLGVIIDDKLNFSAQSAEIGKKLSRLQGVFYSLSSLVPQRTLLTLYNSLVYPVITQSIIIWGGVRESNLKNIKIGMNKILRHVLGVRYDENNVPLMSSNEMYKSLKLLKFDDIYKFFLLKFVHYAYYQNCDIFRIYFSHLLPTHNYCTRGNNINLPSVRLEVEKQGTIFQCCKVINEVPHYLLEPQSPGMLKKRYKSWVISKYESQSG